MANSQRYTREIPHRFRLEAQRFSDGYVTLANRYISPDRWPACGGEISCTKYSLH